MKFLAFNYINPLNASPTAIEYFDGLSIFISLAILLKGFKISVLILSSSDICSFNPYICAYPPPINNLLKFALPLFDFT